MANTFKSVSQQNVGTSIVAVYTVPGSTQATVMSIILANTSSADIVGSVYITISGVQTFLVKDAPIVKGSSLSLGVKLGLAAGNVISFKSSAASSADALVSVLEMS